MTVGKQFLDHATDSVFGKSADTLLPETTLDAEQFLHNFDCVMRGVGLRQAYGKFTFLRGRETQWKEAIRQVHKVVDQWIDQTLSENRETRKHDPSRVILVEELAKEGPDRTELRSQLLNVFFPAEDTTAIEVSDVFFNLARHPRVWGKLRSKVLQVKQPLTYEVLKSLKHMQCVLNESKLLNL